MSFPFIMILNFVYLQNRNLPSVDDDDDELPPPPPELTDDRQPPIPASQPPILPSMQSMTHSAMPSIDGREYTVQTTVTRTSSAYPEEVPLVSNV